MNGRLIAGAVLLALAACGRSGGEAETGNGAAGAAPPAITIATPNGIVEVRSGGVTAGLPEGIPAYPNADAGQNIDINGGSGPGQGRILSFSTYDAPAQVIAFYAQAVAAGGYSVANRMDMGSASTLSARKGAGQAVNIVATQAGGATRVQIIIAAGAG
jgi:hypothetical protein